MTWKVRGSPVKLVSSRSPRSLFFFFSPPCVPHLVLSYLKSHAVCSDVAFATIPGAKRSVPFLFLMQTDELYAQKLKYKAISEELDHALNDMTSM